MFALVLSFVSCIVIILGEFVAASRESSVVLLRMPFIFSCMIWKSLVLVCLIVCLGDAVDENEEDEESVWDVGVVGVVGPSEEGEVVDE